MNKGACTYFKARLATSNNHFKINYHTLSPRCVLSIVAHTNARFSAEYTIVITNSLQHLCIAINIQIFSNCFAKILGRRDWVIKNYSRIVIVSMSQIRRQLYIIKGHVRGEVLELAHKWREVFKTTLYKFLLKKTVFPVLIFFDQNRFFGVRIKR